jgi:hypothetical protein
VFGKTTARTDKPGAPALGEPPVDVGALDETVSKIT